METKTLIYDGTFDGFLTAVFYSYEYKLDQVIIQSEKYGINALFSEYETVITSKTKADRVWKGLKSILSPLGSYQIHAAFLSELPHIENVLLAYIRQVFTAKHDISKDFGNDIVLKVAKTSKMVGREKHRMEAFVRFKLTKDDIYFATIEPDFNVLPLIIKHFKKRYADQQWIIYDSKRQYGFYYDLKELQSITLSFEADFDGTKTEAHFFKAEELQFQRLWRDYFKSTNIESRKNMKLHIRHVPKRYWKYLSEKLPEL